MTELETLLEKFAAGGLRLDQLQESLAALAQADGNRSRLAAALQQAHGVGRIATDVFEQLMAAVPPVTDGSALYDDATVMAGRQARGSGSSTVLRAMELDDATRVAAVGDYGATEEATRVIKAARPPVATITAAKQDIAEMFSARPAQQAQRPAEVSFETGGMMGAEAALGQATEAPATVSTLSGTLYDGTMIAAGGRSVHPDQELKVGSVLKERFVLEEVLGGGGMGVVFKALDLRKSEARDKEPYVALKVLNAEFRENPISLIALQRETKRTQTLSHPNIINVFDFDRDGQHVFMSMEHLSGRPLNHLIRELKGQGLPFKKAWPLIKQMGEALGYAHQKDIVHSDFKPGNVFVGESNELKVLDFGIACVAERAEKQNADHTLYDARKEGAMTPAYASLEMLEGKEPDPTDDIYALGCVAYELLAGKHPYGKLQADKALELKLQPKPISGLNRRQWRALQRALALRREQRVRSVSEFLAGMGGRSPVFYALWALGLAALAATGTSVYLSLMPTTEAPRPAVVLTPEQQAKIHDLLELAGIHFEVGYLTAPTGSNALWAYREVLKIDPYNEDAVKGLGRIADSLEQSAWEAFERGDRAESLRKVMDGLEAVPDHAGLLSLRGKLER